MTLSVIGPGFGRTGTMSLQRALTELGLGPCHHMEEVMGRPEQWPYWRAVAAREQVDFAQVFAGFGAQVDWPGADYWRELMTINPDAKVVLSVRPEDKWWASFSDTIGPFMANMDKMSLPPPVKEMFGIMVELIGHRTIGGNWMNKETALAAYRRRIAEVKAEVPAERLLVFDVAEGWGPLCAFLGKPVPATPFPRTNAKDDFWTLVGGRPAGV